jgi:hypothetical protein
MMKLDVKQLIIYLSVAFIVLAIWRDPGGSASTAGDFLGSVGGFLTDVIDKSLTFLKGLSD